jgi:hypothetical protein
MARAGVFSDIAELVLGHKIPGVRGVYDRHSYADEKRDALEKLRSLVKRILDGAVAELVGIEGGVVSGVLNLESSGVEASDWRPRHDEHYHEA